jgi:hypothetical protein
VDVARRDGERQSVLPLGRPEVSEREEELSELDARPGRRFSTAAGRVGGELHRLDRRLRTPEQFARVRDSGVGDEARLELAEPVERPERRVVPAEFEQRVADDRLGCGDVRRVPLRAAGEGERVGETVPRERERPEPGRRLGVRLVERERPAQRALGARIEAWVGGFPGALLVGEPEQDVPAGVRPAPQLRLEPCDEVHGVTRREPSLQSLVRDCRDRTGRRSRR